MSYCMTQTNVNWHIKKENFSKALTALKEQEHQLEGYFGWGPKNDVASSTNLKEAMDKLWYSTSFNKAGDIVGFVFLGEKLSNDREIFLALAPHSGRASYIEFRGENNDMWRWVVEEHNGQSKLVEKQAKITWEDSF